MKIRKARQSDVNAIYELTLDIATIEETLAEKNGVSIIKKRHTDFENRVKFTISQDIKEKDTLFLIAEHDGSVIACGKGSIISDHGFVFNEFRYGNFMSLVVKREWRRKGVAKLLYRELEQWFKENNCSLISLEVFEENNAQEVYEKLGFSKLACKMVKRL